MLSLGDFRSTAGFEFTDRGDRSTAGREFCKGDGESGSAFDTPLLSLLTLGVPGDALFGVWVAGAALFRVCVAGAALFGVCVAGAALFEVSDKLDLSNS